MGCPHGNQKMFGVSVNCPMCAMDKALELCLKGEISLKKAWEVVKLIRDKSLRR